MKKPILLLQSRPEDVVAENEYESICRIGGIEQSRVVRLQMDRDDLGEVNLDDYCAVIMGGGPANFANPEEKKSEAQKRFEPWLVKLMKSIVAEDKPYFGMCLGIGALSMALDIKPSFKYHEPLEPIEIVLSSAAADDPVCAGVSELFMALSGHKEGIGEAPDGCVELARSKTCLQMYRYGQNVYATQFHPELDLPGLAVRVEAYKHNGYFPPEEGDLVMQKAMHVDFTDSMKVLQNFVKRYVADI